jgi:succinate-semialdehyde dehydrogenase/glutarate-semialdehyde dehydrogenase
MRERKDCKQVRFSHSTLNVHKFFASGQSCTAAKRFIAVERVYEEFCNKFVEKMKSLKMGDPMNEDTDLGPISRRDLRDKVHSTVEQAG